jgi:hypothetical protein
LLLLYCHDLPSFSPVVFLDGRHNVSGARKLAIMLPAVMRSVLAKYQLLNLFPRASQAMRMQARQVAVDASRPLVTVIAQRYHPILPDV